MGRTDIAGTRAFFGPRATDWEVRFPDDGPSYEHAVAELAPPVGGVVLDAACGTGRALPALRSAVGSAGTVLAVDLTVEMLAEATRQRRDALANLLLADVTALPIGTATVDGVFGAGLIPHLPDPWPAWLSSPGCAAPVRGWPCFTRSAEPGSSQRS